MAATLEPNIFFYKDEKGRLKKTKGGLYRFDITFERPNGAPYFRVKGLRFNLEQKVILPISTPINGSVYVVAEVAAGEHDNLAVWLYDAIQENLALERG